jgi:tetratricopeptide (TPR) repeat protein
MSLMDESYLEERERFIEETGALIDGGHIERAREAAERRCATYPGDVDAWLARAACAVRASRFDDALSILRDLDRILPGWPRIAECIGDIYRARGVAPKALASYRAAVTPDGPLRDRITAKIAEISRGVVSGEESAVGGKASVSSHRHLLALVDAYRKAGFTDKALDILKHLLRDDPANAEIARKIGEIESAANGNAAVAAELSRWLARLEKRRYGHG